MYVMPGCPDCSYVEEQIKDDPRFEVINIASHVRKLKEFIALRDHHPAFGQAREEGGLGIPCYVLEDGSVTLMSADVGLKPRPQDGDSCSLDGRGGC